MSATLVLATGAHAGPPYPWWSTVDPRLILCPAGDIAFHVIARRFETPVPGTMLVVDFCNATGWAFDPAAQPPEIFFPGPACLAAVYGDATGLASFALRAGGTTADSTVALSVDGMPFGQRFLSSPDQDGDLLVNAADEAILVSKLGSNDLSADFDADGVVTAADRTFLRAHLGHATEQPVSATAGSWGRLKIAYR